MKKFHSQLQAEISFRYTFTNQSWSKIDSVLALVRVHNMSFSSWRCLVCIVYTYVLLHTIYELIYVRSDKDNFLQIIKYKGKGNWWTLTRWGFLWSISQSPMAEELQHQLHKYIYLRNLATFVRNQKRLRLDNVITQCLSIERVSMEKEFRTRSHVH